MFQIKDCITKQGGQTGTRSSIRKKRKKLIKLGILKSIIVYKVLYYVLQFFLKKKLYEEFILRKIL